MIRSTPPPLISDTLVTGLSQTTSPSSSIFLFLHLCGLTLKEGPISFVALTYFAVHLIIGCSAVSMAAADEASQLRPPLHHIAKVCFAQCSTSRLALGSPDHGGYFGLLRSPTDLIHLYLTKVKNAFNVKFIFFPL